MPVTTEEALAFVGSGFEVTLDELMLLNTML